jgi:hypothetical protein
VEAAVERDRDGILARGIITGMISVPRMQDSTGAAALPSTAATVSSVRRSSIGPAADAWARRDPIDIPVTPLLKIVSALSGC